MKNRSLVRLGYGIIALVAGVYACSEATDGLVPYDVRVTPNAANADGGGASGPDEPPGGGDDDDEPVKTFDATTVTTGVVVLNEIGASDEWIEIVNSGNGEVDVSGWQVADRDKDTGEPKLSEAITFPEGTRLKPNGYLLVKGGGDGGDPCPDGPGGKPTYCFYAEFGISNKNGETIFLIAGDGGVQGATVYPPDAANGKDISWGRMPNGDPKGEFVITASTPGAKNAGL